MASAVNVFSILFFVVFALVLAVFAVTIVRILKQFIKNNNSPRLTVAATIVAKRTHTSMHHDGVEPMMHHRVTSYYATFEVASGDRMELQVPGREYGLLAEGDKGNLTFQGTRFLGFERR